MLGNFKLRVKKAGSVKVENLCNVSRNVVWVNKLNELKHWKDLNAWTSFEENDDKKAQSDVFIVVFLSKDFEKKLGSWSW